MQMLYNSENFVVVQFDMPVEAGAPARGGFDIVDKLARKEIFIEGALAERFKLGVQALAEATPRLRTTTASSKATPTSRSSR